VFLAKSRQGISAKMDKRDGASHMEITVDLPDDVVATAQAEGLLDAPRLTEVLRAELRRMNAARKLGEMVDAIRAVEPPLTGAEIQAELAAATAERVATPGRKLSRRELAGLHRGAMVMHDDFDEPLPDSFWFGDEP
jgi:hypothetical protein